MRISDCSSDVCSSDLINRLNNLQIIEGTDDRCGDTDCRKCTQPRSHGCVKHQEFRPEAEERRNACQAEHEDRKSGRQPFPGLRKARQACAVLNRIAILVAHLKRSEEHTSELQSLMRNSFAVFCFLKNKKQLERLTI